jgi:hypothetical protein
MRRGAWAFVLVLMTAVVCASAIPQPDLPETSYNEVDTPVNQAPPVVQGIRFVRPAVAKVVLPKQACETGRDVTCERLERKSARTPEQRKHNSLQDLLCTFLI